MPICRRTPSPPSRKSRRTSAASICTRQDLASPRRKASDGSIVLNPRSPPVLNPSPKLIQVVNEQQQIIEDQQLNAKLEAENTELKQRLEILEQRMNQKDRNEIQKGK